VVCGVVVKESIIRRDVYQYTILHIVYSIFYEYIGNYKESSFDINHPDWSCFGNLRLVFNYVNMLM